MCHLSKLKFNSQVLAQGDREWNEYLETLGIASFQAIKLVTEAALLGSAIEHGVSPSLIVLSDGAKQFAILVHALCWVHMERSLRRLNGVTAQQRKEIKEVQDTLWTYYRELKAYQEQPTPQEKERLEADFDKIFGQRYSHHYGLNLVMQQFCAHKDEFMRVLDSPQIPLNNYAAESDIRDYVS